MASYEPSEEPDPESSHLILYDGLCGLCNRGNQFVLRGDKAGIFVFASLQGELGQSVVSAFGKDPGRLETLYVISNYGAASARLLSKSNAALFVLEQMPGAWGLLGRALRLLPRRFLDWVYDLVARNRYRIFGRYDRCPLPDPEQRSRFLDVS